MPIGRLQSREDLAAEYRALLLKVLLKQAEPISGEELQAETAARRYSQSFTYAMGRLAKDGLVKNIGHAKATRWFLTDKGREEAPAFIEATASGMKARKAAALTHPRP